MESRRLHILHRRRSASVSAVMDSTTTTARGTMIGSCLPLIEISISSLSIFTVDWGRAMEGVGLMAARTISSEPSLIPPRTPPEWLVLFIICPSWTANASLFVLPFEAAARNPSPISTAFTAPMDMIPFESWASSLSNTGSPSPTGSPVTRHSMIPPQESFCSIISLR